MFLVFVLSYFIYSSAAKKVEKRVKYIHPPSVFNLQGLTIGIRAKLIDIRIRSYRLASFVFDFGWTETGSAFVGVELILGIGSVLDCWCWLENCWVDICDRLGSCIFRRYIAEIFRIWKSWIPGLLTVSRFLSLVKAAIRFGSSRSLCTWKW